MHGALPERYRSWLTLGICLLEEVRIGLVVLGVVGTTWQFQVISFDLINEKLSTMLGYLTARWAEKSHYYDKM